MSTTYAPSPWPAPSQAPAATSWRFARELGHDGGSLALQWSMVRHNSFAPGQLLAVYFALCMLSLSIGVAFWWLGAPAVLPLAGLELMLLGLAFWLCSRHADDAETMTLAERELKVEHRSGRHVERAAFRAEWVRVEPTHGDGSLVELSGQGQRMRVGRYLRPELRMLLATELRLALRRESTRRTSQEMQLGSKR
jgi:uncharacterized membrane protein